MQWMCSDKASGCSNDSEPGMSKVGQRRQGAKHPNHFHSAPGRPGQAPALHPLPDPAATPLEHDTDWQRHSRVRWTIHRAVTVVAEKLFPAPLNLLHRPTGVAHGR